MYSQTAKRQGLATHSDGPPGLEESLIYLLLVHSADVDDDENTMTVPEAEVLYRMRNHRRSKAWKHLRTKWHYAIAKDSKFIAWEEA